MKTTDSHNKKSFATLANHFPSVAKSLGKLTEIMVKIDVSCCLLLRKEKLIPVLDVCFGSSVVLRTNLLKLKIQSSGFFSPLPAFSQQPNTWNSSNKIIKTEAKELRNIKTLDPLTR